MPDRRQAVTLLNLIKLFLILGGTLYVLVCVIMALSQRSFLYYPTVIAPAQVSMMAQEAGLERWTNSAGQPIGFKRLSPTQPARGSIMITYGNGSTAVGSAHFADDIQKVMPLDVYILEYPGYEDRPGRPTQASLLAAAREGFYLVPTNGPIYLVGESLGSAMACYLAGRYTDRIAGILLISPFNRVTAAAQSHYPVLPVSLLMIDRFPSEQFLKGYHGKIGVVVDGKDTVVPEKFGRRLYDGYAGPKKLWSFPDGGHCQITMPQVEFWKEVSEYWQVTDK